MNAAAVAILDQKLKAFWDASQLVLNRIAGYHSWKPGRRNMPQSGKQWREFNARQLLTRQDRPA